MTKRQEWLIATLRKANGGWLSEVDIIQSMIDDIVMGEFEDRDAYQYHNNPKGSHCAAIWKDADEINRNPDSGAVILMKNREFAIAMSENDVYEILLKPTIAKAVNAFRRYWAIKMKMMKQNQGVISFTDGEISFIDLFSAPKEIIEERGIKNGNEKA